MKEVPGAILPIVVGTAGHIDHGKSTLVRALTGIDPDRLKEEKERGLTIDLGFAPLVLPDGRRVGIVDVPGHERFVRNMVAGATGIDFVVLVVAADDGVMPQTREHLQIMELLGVERGLVALTKIDSVEPDLAELAREDVRELLAGTFLAEAPVFPVSAISGEGLEELKQALFRAAAATPPRSADGVFRMPVQRVFSPRGKGTVVTGIPVSGALAVGDTVEVLPRGGRGKVRGIQAYREGTERARSGHSTALNLSDVDHDRVHRGDVVATPGFFHPVRMVGVRLTALAASGRSIVNRMPIRLHTGTADPPGELVLLDCEEIAPGETGLAQLRLAEPVVCAPGDRFVLRQLSPVVTLGGGVILEESRYRLKRFKDFVLGELAHQEESLGSPALLLESVLARRGLAPATDEELGVEVKRPRAEVAAWLDELAAEQRAYPLGRGGRWVHADALEQGLTRLAAALERWFDEHPHREVVDVRDLRAALELDTLVADGLLDAAEARGTLEQLPGGRVRPAGRGGDLDEETQAALERLVAALEAEPFQPPDRAALAARLGVSAEQVAAWIELLSDRGRVLCLGAELVLAASAVERARQAVAANCERNGRLEIPELRDALSTSRKFLIPLLEHFDGVGFTMRQAGHRVLKRR